MAPQSIKGSGRLEAKPNCLGDMCSFDSIEGQNLWSKSPSTGDLRSSVRSRESIN
ncbi:hypothetical protein SAMN05414139_10552 [Burkholderia sp. D7]|nr:hypothetical protein SAMN05414139_10552 [Burkholderia sp. D7]